MAKRFHVASESEILRGIVTDVYFNRTLQILKAKKLNRPVVMEVRTRRLPDNWEWGVLAGVEEVVRLFEGKRCDLEILPEGTLFRPGEPVAELSGMYQDICVYETAMLGFLCQATGIATRAARCRLAAGDRTLLSFGARRMHPAIAPMIERAAYIGGVDGVSTLAAARLIGTEASGTIPHALVLMFGDTLEAVRSFDEVIDKRVKRVALIDTLQDEKFEAVRVAEALGKRLFAVRLDTPASRRGNFKEMLREVRWELDIRGFKNVKVFVSGGIDEQKIIELNEFVDGYGVGTSISNSPTVDFALDIVEMDGKPYAKRGKESGRKSLLRCEKCWTDYIKIDYNKNSCSCGGRLKSLMELFLSRGKRERKLPAPASIRAYVQEQLRKKNFSGGRE